MKKILGLGLAALLVMAMVGGGTWAYFNDVETATDNTITAGTLNLQVGTVDGTVTPITIGSPPGIKPTDAANAGSWLITNIGTLSASLTVAVGATITNDENTRSAIETASGDGSDVGGELGGLLTVAFWLDTNKDGNLDTVDKWLKPSTQTVETWGGADNSTFNFATVPDAYATVDSMASKTWSSVATIAGSGEAGDFMVEYIFPNTLTKYGATEYYTDNVAQGDSVKFNLIFTLQ